MNRKSAPIGVFDSGLGGLTSVSRLSELLPNEDILYLGDTGRVPYGGRGRETIIKYARQDIEFLLKRDIKAILVACGTVSAVALPEIAEDYNVRIYDVVSPTSQKAAAATRNGRIGIIATEASIRSRAYENHLQRLKPDAQVMSRACPLFVPLVENGRVEPGDVVIETVAAEYLDVFRQAGVDTLILGCTHYPLLEQVIGAYMGPEVALINSGAAAAEQLTAEITEVGLLNDQQEPGLHRYYVSDSTENFAEQASIFLRENACFEVRKVDLDSF